MTYLRHLKAVQLEQLKADKEKEVQNFGYQSKPRNISAMER